MEIEIIDLRRGEVVPEATVEIIKLDTALKKEGLTPIVTGDYNSYYTNKDNKISISILRNIIRHLDIKQKELKPNHFDDETVKFPWGRFADGEYAFSTASGSNDKNNKRAGCIRLDDENIKAIKIKKIDGNTYLFFDRREDEEEK